MSRKRCLPCRSCADEAEACWQRQASWQIGLPPDKSRSLVRHKSLHRAHARFRKMLSCQRIQSKGVHEPKVRTVLTDGEFFSGGAPYPSDRASGAESRLGFDWSEQRQVVLSSIKLTENIFNTVTTSPLSSKSLSLFKFLQATSGPKGRRV